MTEETKAAETAVAIPTTMTDKVTGKTVINPAGLEPELRKQIVQLSNQLQTQMAAIGESAIKIGHTLKQVEILLAPRKIWAAYLNSIPGMSKNTAYRFMEAFEVASKNLPPVVLNRVMALGLPMIGSKDAPYGRFTKTIAQHNLKPPKPTGDETKDVAAADAWINKVTSVAKEARGKGRAKVNDEPELQKQAYVAVLRRYARVPKDRRIKWLRDLFGFIIGNIGLDNEFPVTPLQPPREFVEGFDATDKELSADKEAKGKKGKGSKS